MYTHMSQKLTDQNISALMLSFNINAIFCTYTCRQNCRPQHYHRQPYGILILSLEEY